MDPDYENKIGYIAGFTNGSDYLTEDVNYNIDVEPIFILIQIFLNKSID